ncbi:MAG: hypothetical protein SPJ13_02485 [Bacteroidales bacterium]|nr:hypothetical protein [Bacteroidales bacterium]
MKSFKAFGVIALVAAMACAGGAAAQAKQQKKAGEQKENFFKGTIECVIVDETAAYQAIVHSKSQGISVVSRKESTQASDRYGKNGRKPMLTFSYDDKVSQSTAYDVTSMLLKGEMLAINVESDGESFFLQEPICQANSALCKIAASFVEIANSNDKDSLANFQKKYYTRTKETREIAGVKATAYEMNLESGPVTIWVDESRSTEGTCWPFIGMTHPVLGGAFFMPAQSLADAPFIFEAIKIIDDSAKINKVNMEKGKPVSPRQMEQIVQEQVWKENKQ